MHETLAPACLSFVLLLSVLASLGLVLLGPMRKLQAVHRRSRILLMFCCLFFLCGSFYEMFVRPSFCPLLIGGDQLTLQEMLVGVVSSIPPSYPAHLFKGKGIVMCGSQRQLGLIHANIYVVRKVLKSSLPIEIFHIGDDLTSNDKALLESSFANVTVRDVFSFDLLPEWRELFVRSKKFNLDHGAASLRTITHHSKWPVKPFSLLFSSFREIIMLDSDSIPTRDPAILFEDLEYLKKGNIFWRDLPVNPPSTEFVDAIKDLSGDPLSNFRESETGQVVFNKERCWRGAYTSWLLSSHSDITFRYMLGDKDVFYFGFHLAQATYNNHNTSGSNNKRNEEGAGEFNHIAHGVALAGFYDTATGQMIFSALMQPDTQGRPFFFHHAGPLKNFLLDPPKDSRAPLWTHARYTVGEEEQIEEIPRAVQQIGIEYMNALHEFQSQNKNGWWQFF